MTDSYNSDDLVDMGEAHHQAGRLQQAEDCYRQALALDPGHPGALYFLANIAYADKRLALAEELVNNLLRDEPNDAEAWQLLSMIALQNDDLSRAEASVQRALAVQPSYAQAHYSYGDILSRKMDYDSALKHFEQVVAINPQFAEAYYAIGNILRLRNRVDEALSSFQKAIDSNPRIEFAYLNMGQLLGQQNKFAEAAELYKCALKHFPDSAKIYNDLGNVQVRLAQYDAAMTSMEAATRLDPTLLHPRINLGNLQLDLGKVEDGLATLRKADELDPQSARAKLDIAGGLVKAGRQADAVPWIQASLALDPDNVDTSNFLLCALQYLPEYPRQKTFEDHVAFGERFEAPYKSEWTQRPRTVRPDKRLRVAFVSGDLCGHPVGYFLESVLAELHRKNALDVYVYYTDSEEDALTRRLQASTDKWRVVDKLSDDDFAQQIRDDNIDILIDLSGHTAKNRLLVFARKAAAVQVTWLGYWDTTGLRAIDYLLCDPYSVLPGEEKYFVETPWRLPSTRLCFTPPNDKVPVAPLPARATGKVVFGCFNNLNKMTDRVIAVWARVLARVPSARLLLKWSTLSDAHVRDSVLRRFAQHGISAERILMEGPSPRAEYLAAYGRVDIALDPFPFSGGTTSFEGVWMGVPMVTLKGDRIIARQGECILNNIGLADWIAQTEDDYVELAVQKAQHIDALAELRAQLRGRIEASPLCDAPLFAAHLESAFTEMWARYCALQNASA